MNPDAIKEILLQSRLQLRAPYDLVWRLQSCS